jgi:hypothetical protein
MTRCGMASEKGGIGGQGGEAPCSKTPGGVPDTKNRAAFRQRGFRIKLDYFEARAAFLLAFRALILDFSRKKSSVRAAIRRTPLATT